MITMSSFFEVVPWSRQCHILSVCSERKLKDINQMPNLYLAVWRLSGRKEMPPSWHLIKKDWKNSDLLSMIYQNLLIFCGFHLYSNFSCAVIAVVCIQAIKAKWKMCTQEKLFGGGGKVGGGDFFLTCVTGNPPVQSESVYLCSCWFHLGHSSIWPSWLNCILIMCAFSHLWLQFFSLCSTMHSHLLGDT